MGNLRQVWWIVPTVVFLTTIVLSMVHRFENPELTETQLLLDCWLLYLLMAASCVGSIWVMSLFEKQDRDCSSYPPDHINCRCTRPKDDG